MDFRKYMRFSVLFLGLLLCLAGCGAGSESKTYRHYSREDDKIKDGGLNTKEPAKTISSTASSNGAVSSLSPTSSNAAIGTEGVIDTKSSIDIYMEETPSPQSVDVPENSATEEQKSQYAELSEKMEKIYKDITEFEQSQGISDESYEDYRYFGPLYEYYRGLKKEKCENSTKEEMDRIIQGITEYITEMEQFAAEHGIESS